MSDASETLRKSFLELEALDDPIVKVKGMDDGLARVWSELISDLRRAKGRKREDVVDLVDGYLDALRDIEGMANDTANRLETVPGRLTEGVTSLKMKRWLVAKSFAIAAVSAETYGITLSMSFYAGVDQVASKHDQARAWRSFEEGYGEFAEAIRALEPSYVPRCESSEGPGGGVR